MVEDQFLSLFQWAKSSLKPENASLLISSYTEILTFMHEDNHSHHLDELSDYIKALEYNKKIKLKTVCPELYKFLYM